MEEPNLRLNFKTQECRNRQHLNCNNARILQRCGYYHSEEDRWVVLNERRQRWTPRLESEFLKQQEAIAQQRQAERDTYHAARRAAWIEQIKAHPRYKTSPCRLETEHDPETCSFSHGFDYNVEGAKALGLGKEANATPRNPRPPRQRNYDATQTDLESYNNAFPTLSS